MNEKQIDLQYKQAVIHIPATVMLIVLLDSPPLASHQYSPLSP